MEVQYFYEVELTTNISVATTDAEIVNKVENAMTEDLLPVLFSNGCVRRRLQQSIDSRRLLVNGINKNPPDAVLGGGTSTKKQQQPYRF